MYHFHLPIFSLNNMIVGKVFINPYPTISLFIDGNHGLLNLEPSKPVKQSLKTNQTFLNHIHSLTN